jgi:hypothetical protein
MDEDQRMLCSKCNQELQPSWRACPFCGAAAITGAGGLSVSDSVVKGNLTNTTGAASVGNVVVNLPGAAGSESPSYASLLICPMCGRRNRPDGVFRCRKCGQDHLCLDHFVRNLRMCEECAAKETGSQVPTLGRTSDDREPARIVASPGASEPAKELILDLGDRVTMKCVLIPAGEFLMGSDECGDKTPRHRVRITRSFYMGVHPVTQAQYQAVTGANPSKFKGTANPVEQVSWLDAEEFCVVLSNSTGRKVRLPWARKQPTTGASLTCTETCGSGVRTGMAGTIITVITVTRQRPTRQAPAQGNTVFCAEAVTTTRRATAVQPVATATRPPSSGSVTGFGSWWTWSNTLSFVP